MAPRCRTLTIVVRDDLGDLTISPSEGWSLDQALLALELAQREVQAEKARRMQAGKDLASSPAVTRVN